MKKNKYTKEFKDSTVQLVINTDKSALKVAQDLDIMPKLYIIGLENIKKPIILKLIVEERCSSQPQKRPQKMKIEDLDLKISCLNKRKRY